MEEKQNVVRDMGGGNLETGEKGKGSGGERRGGKGAAQMPRFSSSVH